MTFFSTAFLPARQLRFSCRPLPQAHRARFGLLAILHATRAVPFLPSKFTIAPQAGSIPRCVFMKIRFWTSRRLITCRHSCRVKVPRILQHSFCQAYWGCTIWRRVFGPRRVRILTTICQFWVKTRRLELLSSCQKS